MQRRFLRCQDVQTHNLSCHWPIREFAVVAACVRLFTHTLAHTRFASPFQKYAHAAASPTPMVFQITPAP